MTTTPAAAAADPLAAVAALHAAAGSPAADGDWGVGALFEAVANDEAVAAQVPFLTDVPIESLKPGSLVRYRGMVQDTLDPEYYLGAYRPAPGARWTTTKFQDARVPADAHAAAAGCGGNADAEPGIVHERRPLYCIAVPGERGKEGGAVAVAAAAEAPPPAAAATDRKRTRGGGDADMPDAPDDDAPPAKDGRPASGGSAAGGGDKPADGTKPDAPADLPPPTLRPPTRGDAMVYAYDHTGHAPRLNDVVEVWGVVSVVPELSAAHTDAAADPSSLDWALAASLAAHPPTSAVPRLHALYVRPARVPLPAPAPPPAGEARAAARAAALAHLTAALHGDALAAELVLLQLVARVHVRSAGFAVGSLSVAIGGCPPAPAGAPPRAPSPFASRLAAAVADLAPATLTLPVTVPALNAGRLRPARCPATGRLAAAPLQVAAGTHLLLDETALAPGKLAPVGVDNLQAITTLLASRSIAYDFHYCRVDVPVDAPVTLLTSGRASVLGADSADVATVLAPAAAAAASAAAVPPAALAAARALFDWARHAPFDFGTGAEEAGGGDKATPAAPAWLEAKLVAARRADGGSEARLHTLLTLARLLALSHGETELSEARWDGAAALDAAAAARRAVGPVRSAYTG